MDIKYKKLRTKYDIIINTAITSIWLLLYFFAIPDSFKSLFFTCCFALSISLLVATLIKTKAPMENYIPINRRLMLVILGLISILSIETSGLIGDKLNTYVDNRIKQDYVYGEIPKAILGAELNKELHAFPSLYIEQISQVDAGYETYSLIIGGIAKLNTGTEAEYENYISEQVDQIQSHDRMYYINEILKNSDIKIPYVAIRLLTANAVTTTILVFIWSIWLIEDTILIKMHQKEEATKTK